MARHFARLKLALLASAFKRGPGQAIGLVASVALGLPLAAAAAAGLVLAAPTAAGPPLLVLVFAALAVGWTVAPLLLFGVDETLDPTRLQLLPLGAGQLLAGLTVAALIGVGPVTTLVVLAAGTAYAGGPAGLAVAAAAVIGHLLVCVWAARALATAASALLRSRRGRDLAAVATAVATLGFVGLAQVPNVALNVLDVDADDVPALAGPLGDVADVVALTPPGWAAGAIVAAGEGRWPAAAVSLLGVAALAAGLAWAWQAALRRSLTADDRAGTGARRSADAPLVPAWLAPFGAGRLAATTAKELRYLARLPRLRASLAALVVLAVGLVAAVALVDVAATPAVVYVPAGLALMRALETVNLFGNDRGAAWLLVAAGGPHRADVAGKSLAHLLTSTVVLAPCLVALAALTGGWSHLAPAVVALLVLQLAAHGVGVVASVLAPAPLPQGATNVWGSASGTGCATLLTQLAAMAVQAILVAPAAGALLVAAVFAPGWLPAALAGGVGYAAALWMAGVVLAAARLEAGGPPFVAALSADADG